MKTIHCRWIAALVALLAVAGCSGSKDANSAAMDYAIQGKVVTVDASKPSVRLDLEEVPGLMKAMEMDYPTENARVLEGITAGDRIEGHLKVESGQSIVTHLQKR
jgi:Cu/Ag efflux protein CusF